MSQHHAPHHSAITHKHDHLSPDVLIALTDKAQQHLDHTNKNVSHALKAASYYYGHNAFREFDWLKGAAALNKSGDMRGMVLNKKLRALFDITVRYGDKLKKVDTALVVAGWAVELLKSHTYIEHVIRSKDTGLTKTQKICAEISMATIRSMTGVIPATNHTVATLILKGANRVHIPDKWTHAIRREDMVVSSKYAEITNTDNVVHFFNTHTFIN